MSKMTMDKHGNQFWQNEAGQFHRIDGPAYIHPNGTQSWYIDGLRHRLDGPAYIAANGTQSWWINDKLHRLDGPAYITANGYHLWWLNGFGITDQVIDWIKENDFPAHTLWTDGQKIMFLLAFSGISS